MKVMQEEAKNTGKPEDMTLKILAHNNLVGRIIGKQVENNCDAIDFCLWYIIINDWRELD